MRRAAWVGGLMWFAMVGLTLAQPGGPPRPKITGIAEVDIESIYPQKTMDFYGLQLGLRTVCADCDGGERFAVGDRQFIGVSYSAVSDQETRWQRIVFEVSSVEQMQRYLRAHGFHAFVPIPGGFVMSAPEGRRIGFVHTVPKPGDNGDAVSTVLLHAGFVVNDREAEDAFYRDVLGFKLYWEGSQAWDGNADHIQYVAMQVPDGREWVEYIVNGRRDWGYGSDDHLSLGMPDIHAAYQKLVKNGWPVSNHVYVGKDGRWSLSLMDPGGTRVELMEFKPVHSPCCTEYLQPHYSPNVR